MKKATELLFCLLFVGLLLVPLALTDFRKDQVSELDNTYLPEIDWSETVSPRDRIDQLEVYLNMRVGLRAPALDLYVRLNDRVFGLMDHPTYMYGREGWVFYKTPAYLLDYQHLNLDQPWAEHFAGWMQTFSDMAREQGADFYYLLIPDKKTVYREYFPAGFNVQGDVSRTDQVLAALEQTDVDWFYCLDLMLEAKKSLPVANVKYDAGHWNENGAFVVLQALLERFRERHPEIPALERSEFDVGAEHKDSLQTSHFPIDEDVPLYTRRQTDAKEDRDWLKTHLTAGERENYCTHYVDPSHPELPKLLVIHDSYLMHDEKFFLGHFSEITFLHRYNLTGPQVFRRWLEEIQPDIILFENPERSFEIRFDPEK